MNSGELVQEQHAVVRECHDYLPRGDYRRPLHAPERHAPLRVPSVLGGVFRQRKAPPGPPGRGLRAAAIPYNRATFAT
jgi:hypothetical protein